MHIIHENILSKLSSKVRVVHYRQIIMAYSGIGKEFLLKILSREPNDWPEQVQFQWEQLKSNKQWKVSRIS